MKNKYSGYILVLCMLCVVDLSAGNFSLSNLGIDQSLVQMLKSSKPGDLFFCSVFIDPPSQMAQKIASTQPELTGKQVIFGTPEIEAKQGSFPLESDPPSTGFDGDIRILGEQISRENMLFYQEHGNIADFIYSRFELGIESPVLVSHLSSTSINPIRALRNQSELKVAGFSLKKIDQNTFRISRQSVSLNRGKPWSIDTTSFNHQETQRMLAKAPKGSENAYLASRSDGLLNGDSTFAIQDVLNSHSQLEGIDFFIHDRYAPYFPVTRGDTATCH